MRIGSTGGGYVARGLADNGDVLRWLSFGKWWEEPVIRDAKRRLLSRKNLVFSLRNQDGGAHFDTELTDPVYRGIAKENSVPWMFLSEGNKPRPLVDLHLATMRQIGWEMQASLKRIIEQFPR